MPAAPRGAAAVNYGPSSSLLAELDTPAEVRQFLLDLCTPAELEAMVDRWWVANLLTEGLSYRDISDITGVSVTTVGRVARFMSQGEGGYRIALERMQKEEQ